MNLSCEVYMIKITFTCIIISALNPNYLIVMFSVISLYESLKLLE